MAIKRLTKELLSDLMVRNPDLEPDSEILLSAEVQAMMEFQWNRPGDSVTSHAPDFKSLFEKIRERTIGKSKLQHSENQLLIEIQELRARQNMLRKRLSLVVSLAASVILLISLATFYIFNTNQVFRKTYTENIAPRGQKSNVILPDGTKAFLNSGSMLRYDNFFAKKYRMVELVGEAYFEVSANEKLPFIIHAGDIEVKVLGTKFNVMAYPEDNFIETMVKEGKVTVTDRRGSSRIILTANQRATFNKTSRQMLMNDAKPDLYTSWKENLLTFDNENFGDVIKKLERWYDVKILVEGTDSIRDRFTLTIKSESLREVLELISLTTNIEYTIKANEVTITYK
jgi:transmembrane sensor